jgi:hypothetical protein
VVDKHDARHEGYSKIGSKADEEGWYHSEENTDLSDVRLRLQERVARYIALQIRLLEGASQLVCDHPVV